jgi:flagella basal body P-ring formation protein FlgA
MSIRRFFTVLCWCFIILCIEATPAFCLDVYLKEFVTYNNSSLYLGDIINMKNSDDTVEAALLSLPLQLSSHRIHVLSSSSIRALIETHYSGALIIIGKKTVCVPDNAIPEFSAWFIKDLLSFLDAHDYNSQGRLEIEVLDMSGIDFKIQVSELRFSLQNYQMSNGHLVGKIDIHAHSLNDINKFSKVISLFFHRFLTVPVPIRPLEQGERLSKSDLLFVEKDIAYIQENILLENMSCDRYITLDYLHPSETIPLAKIKTDFLIKKGDHISIIFLSRGIHIVTRGRAMQSGYIGTEVLVQPSTNTKKFVGTIINEKEVVVELE